MKFSIKDFFSKCDQIRSFQPIWAYLLKKSLMENFIFYAVWGKQDINLFKNSRPEVLCKKGVLENFAKFTGK